LLIYFHGNADFDYAANVISNATCHSAGRKLILETNPSFFLPKLKELSHCPTLMRRLRISETIKNLCFSHKEHIELFLTYELLESLGAALIETQQGRCAKVLDESATLCEQWKTAFLKADESCQLWDRLSSEPGIHESLTHCLLDSIVLLVNEDAGISRLIELGGLTLLDLCRIKALKPSGAALSYNSFMEGVSFDEKEEVLANQMKGFGTG
jgi:hypothetical protein